MTKEKSDSPNSRNELSLSALRVKAMPEPAQAEANSMETPKRAEAIIEMALRRQMPVTAIVSNSFIYLVFSDISKIRRAEAKGKMMGISIGFIRS